MTARSLRRRTNTNTCWRRTRLVVPYRVQTTAAYKYVCVCVIFGSSLDLSLVHSLVRQCVFFSFCSFCALRRNCASIFVFVWHKLCVFAFLPARHGTAQHRRWPRTGTCGTTDNRTNKRLLLVRSVVRLSVRPSKCLYFHLSL